MAARRGAWAQFRELIAPASQPDPPHVVARLAEERLRRSRRSLRERAALVREGWRDYVASFRIPFPPNPPAQRAGVEEEAAAADAEEGVALREELRASGRAGAEALRPALRELFAGRAAAYRDAVREFVLAHREANRDAGLEEAAGTVARREGKDEAGDEGAGGAHAAPERGSR